MIKNRKEFHGTIHASYWGVLVRDSNIQVIHKPETFMSLLQAQSQKDVANDTKTPVIENPRGYKSKVR